MAVRTPLLDYYEVLGVAKDAGPGEIERAFKSGIIRYRDIPGSGEQTRRLNLAYRALINPERRRDYDAALRGEPPPEREERADAPVAAGAAAGAASLAAAEEAPPPQPPVREELVEDYEEEPRPRGAPLWALGALAAVLLLVAGLWAGGMFGSDPQVASRDANGASTVKIGNGERPAEERGGLAGALASLLPSDDEPAAVPLPTTEEQAAAGAVTDGVVTAQAGTDDVAPPPLSTSQGVAAAGADGDVAVAAEEPASTPATDPIPEPAPPPAAEPRAAPAPTPAPVDRSAPARLLRGGLVDADNRGGRFAGSVGVRLRVATNGRPQGCQVTRSSGNAALDQTTCSLLQQRLQFAPARDRDGNPVTVEVESTHTWARRRGR